MLLGHHLCPPSSLRPLTGLLTRFLLALPATVDGALGLINGTLERVQLFLLCDRLQG